MSHQEDGFSAAELLVALFIGAVLILAAYQLFSVVTGDGAASRQRAVASNLAYQNLRVNTARVGLTCTARTTTPAPPTGTGLINPSISVQSTCPFGTSSAITKVQVTVRYGSPQLGVTHAMYATKNN